MISLCVIATMQTISQSVEAIATVWVKLTLNTLGQRTENALVFLVYAAVYFDRGFSSWSASEFSTQ